MWIFILLFHSLCRELMVVEDQRELLVFLDQRDCREYKALREILVIADPGCVILSVISLLLF